MATTIKKKSSESSKTSAGTKAPASKKTEVAPAARKRTPAAAKAPKAVAKVSRKTPLAKAAETMTEDLDNRQRIYVLDTNVLLHDPLSVLKFMEHIVYIPMVTLEELDNKKQGTTDVNRNARESTRRIEEITTSTEGSLEHGYDLSTFNGNVPGGLLMIQAAHLGFLEGETTHKNDNLYLAVLKHLEATYPHKVVVMVTKDLNLRVKARAMGHRAEDYRHDHAVEDAKIFFSGIHTRTNDWLQLEETGAEVKEVEGLQYLVVNQVEGAVPNEFVHITDTDVVYQVVGNKNGKTLLEERPSNKVFGVAPRNEEQRAAMALLMDPDVDLVALLGPAGTGKTLLTLAAGLEQVLGKNGGGVFEEIIFTRATVPLGDDVGFLPGNEEEKMMPWLGALTDNVEVLAEAQGKNQNGKGYGQSSSGKSLKEQAQEVVRPKAMTFMRGRSFQRKLLIIDEAQNLTPKQMKALMTRAGEGTKVVCMGNLAQIDSPYLSEQSSGLSYIVQRFKGWQHFGALILEKGVRSRLATESNSRL